MASKDHNLIYHFGVCKEQPHQGSTVNNIQVHSASSVKYDPSLNATVVPSIGIADAGANLPPCYIATE